MSLYGPIVAPRDAQETLESYGIELGYWNAKDATWENCTVPQDALDKLDKHWGEWIWSLEE